MPIKPAKLLAIEAVAATLELRGTSPITCPINANVRMSALALSLPVLD